MSRLGIKIGACLVMMAGVLVCLSSCIKDDFMGKGMSRDYSSVTISVLLPEPVVTTPATRAGATDFDKMNDLNVLVAEGQRVKANVFFEFDAVENGQTIGGMQVYYTDAVVEGGILRSFSLHFTKEWLNEKGLSPMCEFYLVANYGSEIEVDTVDELNALTVHTEDVPGDNAWSYIQTPSVMVGKKMSDKMGTHKHPELDGDVDDCRIIEMELQRLAAMVTLQIDGSGLDAGVVITPTRISLHNVPTQCTIGENNSITTELGGITPKDGAVAENGESKSGGSLAQTGAVNIVGEATQSWSNFADETRYTTTIGKHYEGTEYTDPSVQAFFLYENYHGENFGATDATEQTKRPAAAGGVSKEQIDAVAGACSYLEVDANYTYYSQNSSVPDKYGTISFRFFLGADIIKDFNVMRNTYYKVSLTLTGGVDGINETWRVNRDVSEAIIIGDDEIVLGGGGEIFCVQLTSYNKNIKISDVEYNPATPFIFVEQGSNKKGWQELTGNIGNAFKIDQNESTGLYEIWFYVQPMIRDATWHEGEDDHVRTAHITFAPNSGQSTTITVTQYEPVRIIVTKEDVAGEDMQDVKNMIDNYYNCDLENGDVFEVYVDRIDRPVMPWGFSSVLLDQNHYSGFENTYHLIDPPTGDATCIDHQDFAREHYLPTGKSWRDNVNSADLDYTRGSCMMHAAFMNHYQQYRTVNDLNGVTTEDLALTKTLPSRPTENQGGVDNDLFFAWCVPSIVGWQMLEKLDKHERKTGNPNGIFDPDYPIIPFYSYWTSNAATNNLPPDIYTETDPTIKGKTNAFVYQFGAGLDVISEGETYGPQYLMNRNTPLPYRLISIRPSLLKDESEITDTEPNPMTTDTE